MNYFSIKNPIPTSDREREREGVKGQSEKLISIKTNSLSCAAATPAESHLVWKIVSGERELFVSMCGDFY